MTNEHDPFSNIDPVRIPGTHPDPNNPFTKGLNEFDPLSKIVHPNPYEDIVTGTGQHSPEYAHLEGTDEFAVDLSDFLRYNPDATQDEVREFVQSNPGDGVNTPNGYGTHTLHWNGKPTVAVRDDGRII